MNITTRTYYSLEDLIIKKKTYWSTSLDVGYPEIVGQTTYFASLVSNMFETSLDDVITSDKANILFCTYIAPRNKKMFVGFTEDESENDCYLDFIRNYLFILHSTYDKYSTIIDIYTNQLNSLMDGIKSIAETKFNDTPQNIQGVYDWDTDDHLTNVSRSEVENETSTKMQRINEIQTSLSNIYNMWADEFKRLFIYE